MKNIMISKNVMGAFVRCPLLLVTSAVLLVSGCGGSSNKEGASNAANQTTSQMASQAGSAAAIKIESEIVVENPDANDVATVETFMQERNHQLRKLSRQMAGYFSGPMAIDNAQGSVRNGVMVPALIYDGKPLNNDNTFPQKLTAETLGAGVATIFVKAGDEFVRISTSLKRTNAMTTNPDDTEAASAVGTLLNRFNPAYAACRAGNTYSGTVTLFGKIYLTEYVPIFDKDGKTIGIQFVGLNISDDIAALSNALNDKKSGSVKLKRI